MPLASVESLLLDAENPRLPEELQHGEQSSLFRYMNETGVLEELVDSMIDNGFFQHEPLITLSPNADGKRVVIEGNRRAAALMLLHHLPQTDNATLLVEPNAGQLERLKEIPVFDVNSRDEVRNWLGFRHISGLKPWPAEAKARYIVREVERAAQAHDPSPFVSVGRQVGSNALGVRNSYVAFALLQHSRAECGAQTTFVLNERFTVWQRCMNSPDIRKYVGLGDPRTFEEVRTSILRTECGRLSEIVADLTPASKDKKPVVQDSREVTSYGKVLVDDRARGVLRRLNDLQAAAQLVSEATLPGRAHQIRRRIEALKIEIEGTAEPPTTELIEAVDGISHASKLLSGTVRTLSEQ